MCFTVRLLLNKHDLPWIKPDRAAKSALGSHIRDVFLVLSPPLHEGDKFQAADRPAVEIREGHECADEDGSRQHL